jgi:hypothetical protein
MAGPSACFQSQGNDSACAPPQLRSHNRRDARSRHHAPRSASSYAPRISVNPKAPPFLNGVFPQAARASPHRGVGKPLCTPDTQPIRHPVDVIKPGGEQIDLEDCRIIEANAAQCLNVLASHGGRPQGQLLDILEHGAVTVVQLGGPPVVAQGVRELLIKADATQKLCVRFKSIDTAIERRDCGRDHLVLAS